MLVWVLMALDFVVFFSVSLAHFGAEVGTGFLLLCGAYLIGKGVAFKDTMSIIDAVFGVYVIIIAIFGASGGFYYLFLVWFAYKFISLFTK